MKTFFTLFISLFLVSTSAFAQLLVNTNWANEIGLPQPDIAWSASIARGPHSGPITVGNTTTSTQGVNILISVHNRSGQLIWEQQWNGASGGDDYGTAVAYEGNLIVVAGATYNATQAAMDYVVLGYNANNGTLLWTRIYNGPGNGHDIPAAIWLDAPSSRVYVTGGSYGSSSLMDYATLCLNSSNGNIVWQERYDYGGYYDAAVKISGNSIIVSVTGASGDAFNDWDFCIVTYNKSNGTLTNTKRIENASWYFDQPTDMLQDTLGNVYICGITNNINGDTDIKVLKMNMALNLLWERTIDVEGEDDSATAIEIDDAGNTYITGYYTTAANTKGFVAYKLNSSGTTVWSKKFAAPWGGDFVGTDVSRRGNDYIYTGHLQGENGTTDMLVYLLDQNGNQKLFTTFNYETNDEHGVSVEFSEDNSFIVYGTTTSPAGDKRYLNVRYEYTARDMEPAVIDSMPAYHKTEMIARFRTNVLKYDFIDDKGLRFAKLEDVVTPTALTAIETALDTRAKHWTVSKIFPYLTSANQTMLNAHGIEVQLPQFYTWLTLSIPKDETIEEVIPILDALGSVFVDVSFNECVVPFSVPNDIDYDLQKSLHLSISPVTVYPYHIDVEAAWDYSVGSGTVDEGTNTTVGLFDSGIKQNHEDLYVLAGYDYYSNAGNSIPLDSINDIDGHGTAMAGIIAARRNNGIGVAGIAGGDWIGDKHGANIVNYKIMGNNGGFPADPEIYYSHMNTVLEAMIAASSIGSQTKVDVYNCSWGVNDALHGGGIPPQYSAMDECALMLTCLAEQGAVLIAASGNHGGNNLPIYPATTRPSGLVNGYEYTGSPNEFAIVVGGSDVRGLHVDFANRGDFVDVIAPAEYGLSRSTHISDLLPYQSTGETSAAAAHVSGVCALLHEYLTNSTDALLNAVSTPVAEDYEKIITNSAFDIIPSTNPLYAATTAGYSEGWDNLSGYGILNARSALEYVDFDHYKIWHFTASGSQIASNIEGTDTLLFTQEYNTVPGMIGRPTGRYVCDTYRLTSYPQHDINGETVLDFWPLHSMSNTYDVVYQEPFYSRIMQFPQAQILACSDTAANLRAYTFFIKHPEGQPGDIINQWYPVNPTDARISYSVYSTPAPMVGVDNYKTEWEFSLFPNPATNQLSLKLPRLSGSYLDISIHDLSGKMVQQERNTIESSGNKIKVMDISALASGVYLCSIKAENKVKTFKFIKQ